MMEERGLRELVELLMRYFVNPLGRWVDLLRERRIERDIRIEDVYDVLEGRITINLPCIDKNRKGRWICVDIDNFEQGIEVYAILRKLGISFVPERSMGDNNGWHFWILFKPTEYNRLYKLARKIDSLLRMYGITKVEVFPKSESVDIEKGGFGTCVRFPLSKHPETKQFSYFANEQGVK